MENHSIEDTTNLQKEYRIMMIGLDSSGKTVILYRLLLDTLLSTIPTIGFNVETVRYKNLSLTIWDLGGSTIKLRNLWKDYSEGIAGIIYVIDSSDINRLPESQELLINFLQKNEFEHIPILVFCNKQDLPNALAIGQIKARLNLRNEVLFQSCSAVTGEGVNEGLKWLGDTLNRI